MRERERKSDPREISERDRIGDRGRFRERANVLEYVASEKLKLER